jgi:hypothetical protein
MTKDDDWQKHLKWQFEFYMQAAEDHRYELKGLVFFNIALAIAQELKDYSEDYKK